MEHAIYVVTLMSQSYSWICYACKFQSPVGYSVVKKWHGQLAADPAFTIIIKNLLYFVRSELFFSHVRMEQLSSPPN